MSDSIPTRDAAGPGAPGAALWTRTWAPPLHLLALWAFAVAQPTFDVLRRNGEFFIAHRTRPLDLLLFAALVAFGVPLLLALVWRAAAWLSPRLGGGLLTLFVGGLVTALASQVMAHRIPLPTTVHFAIAAAVGILAAWLYRSRPPVRGFLGALSVSAVFFPALFLLHPSMAAFVRTDTRDTDAAAAFTGTAPPIVFVVFDQLPLTSLMNTQGQIDRDAYPGFARLADRATWYRNASTVADFTGWAVPPIVSGVRPRAGRTPTTRAYPYNLFTWLGESYRLEVQEPITQLCPERLCDAGRDPVAVRMTGMLTDSAVVYLSAALPAGPRALLPPLDENWKGFIDAHRWQGRWVVERDQDRRRVPEQLIQSIGRDDPQPTLYFAHALLPHEPYIYMANGKAFTDVERMPGLLQTGRWTADPWPVTIAYGRHLLQLGYVDGVIGRLVDRLEAQGLFDRALIVVTSDHGASFRPGLPFKGLQGETVPDMMAVPLLIKAPGQKAGAIDDRNIQSVDIMPIVSSLVGVPLTWKADGRHPDAGPLPATKTIHHTGARSTLVVEAGWLAKGRAASVARKAGLFGEHAGWRAPAALRPDLVGQRLDRLPLGEGPWQSTVDDASRLRAPSATAAALTPALLSGRVRDRDGRGVDAEVAVAVGGTIAAVTKTFQADIAPRGTWMALVDPRDLAAGGHDVRVFILPRETTAPLQLAYDSRARPEHLNLSSNGAREFWAIVQTGFYGSEGGRFPYRWTSGDATLVVPFEGAERPRSLRLGLWAVRKGGSAVAVTINGCELFSGTVPEAPWYRTFSLGACPPGTLDAPDARIAIRTASWTPERDRRTLGVAVETVNLYSQDWPIAPDSTRQARGLIRQVDAGNGPHAAGEAVRLEVANTGTATWLPLAEAPAPGRAIQLAIRWKPRGARGAPREQRLQLPRPLYPTDRVVIEAPLVPPRELPASGPWTVTITPVEGDGKDVPTDEPLVMDVLASRP